MYLSLLGRAAVLRRYGTDTWYESAYLYINLSIYLTNYSYVMYLSAHMSAYLSIDLSTYLSICLSVSLFIHGWLQHMCTFAHIYICLHVYIGVYSIYISPCINVHICIHVSIHTCICKYVKEVVQCNAM